MIRFAGLTFPASGSPVAPEVNALARVAHEGTWQGDGLWLAWSAVGCSRQTVMPTIDGTTVIIGHILLCERTELIRQLRSAGVGVGTDDSDSHLILHSYRVWQDQFVEHLNGEYCFALWDAGTRKLFCVRDRLGIRPLYYSEVGGELVFSNDLSWLLLHPHIDREINDVAVGDFLLCGFNLDHATTSYRNVARVRAGHFLQRDVGSIALRRHYEIPRDGHITYARESEYAEHLLELLKCAVADRLPDGPLAMRVSGGMDSTSLAATAREVAPHASIKGFTGYYGRIMPADHEREFAQEAADFMGLPLEAIAWDDTPLFGEYSRSIEAELSDDVFRNDADPTFEMIASFADVVIGGDSGDHLFLPPYDFFRNCLKRFAFVELRREAARFVKEFGYAPPLGIRTFYSRVRGKDRYPLPDWINREFAESIGLAGRYEAAMAASVPHPTREYAHRILSSPLPASSMFERDYARASSYDLESRHPFSDTRLIEYLLSIPGTPFMFHKLILREAMRGRLPERVRIRPKTPLPEYCVAVTLRDRGCDYSFISESRNIARYIDVERHPTRAEAGLALSDYQPFLNTGAASLARWLSRQGA